MATAHPGGHPGVDMSHGRPLVHIGAGTTLAMPMQGAARRLCCHYWGLVLLFWGDPRRVQHEFRDPLLTCKVRG